MADCTYCGNPAGLGSNFHVECKEAQAAVVRPVQSKATAPVASLTVGELQQMLVVAGKQAGKSAALTLILYSIAVGILVGLIEIALH